MTHYSVPFWSSQLPKTRRPALPQLREAMACDVVIVGGGLTGCTTAYVFAAAGVRTCLLEAGGVGQEATGADAGLIRPTPFARFVDLEASCGRRAARRVWEASRHAALDFAALLRRLKIRCSLEPCDVVAIAIRGEDAVLLKREHKALRDAGLDGVWLNEGRLSRELSIDALGGIRAAGGARLDPYRACLGLAKAAAARGARVFEHSAVTRVRWGRAGVEVETRRAPIAARAVVIATAGTVPLFKPLERYLTRLHSYAALTPPLPTPLLRQLGRGDAAVTVGADASRLMVRTKDGRLLFAGADQPRIPGRSRPRTVIQRTGQLMYELSLLHPEISGIQPDYGWDAPVVETRDGVVLAGPHRNYPHHLFALGAGHNGPAAAYLAARILLRCYADEPAAGDSAFGFNRS
jgi:glycine/D-amino acid oxidase-like deaminating enzyme